jgi:hypothetical protein
LDLPVSLFRYIHWDWIDIRVKQIIVITNHSKNFM